MENNTAIEMKQVTKTFGTVIANDHVDLVLNKGEILSILGENGSGKTTLMNMLSGIYFPDEGHIYVNGSEVMQEIFKMLPYLVTIIVLVITSRRNKPENQPPASLGLSYFREER